jgi:hypothetical protein
VIKWFAAQLGSVGVLLLEFLLTVVLALPCTPAASGQHTGFFLLAINWQA